MTPDQDQDTRRDPWDVLGPVIMCSVIVACLYGMLAILTGGWI